MKNRSQKIRLGVFLVISLFILLFIIGFFTAKEFFKKQDIYYVSYEGISVSGLEVGSPVRYLGIKVGSISDIRINPEDVSSVIVELSLKPDTPIKADAKADIVSIGITGLKTIEIRGGSNEAESLEPGSYIQPGSSITEEITGKAEIIAEKAEKVLNNLQVFTQPDNLNKITHLADEIALLARQASSTVNKIDTIVSENRKDIRGTIEAVKEVSDRLDQSSRLLMQSMETINQTVESDTVGQILANFRDVSEKVKEADLKALIDNISRVARQTQQLLTKVDSDINRSSEDFSESLLLLKMTLENLNEASMKINEDPSILLRGSNLKNIPDEKLNK